MIFADAHCDYLSKAALGGTLETPLPEQRITAQSLEKSGLALLNMAAFCGDGTLDEMYNNVLRQIDCFEKLAPGCGKARRLKNGTLIFLSLEGMDYITCPDDMTPILEKPILSAGIMWNRANSLGGGALEDGPLTPAGVSVIKTMEEHGILIDLAHACPRTFFDACQIVKSPFVSHANVKEVVSHPRNLSAEQIKLLIERKSFLGLTFYPPFAGDDLSSLMRHMDFVLELGGEDILGIGSDFDGCSSYVQSLNSPADYCRLYEAMLARGYKQSIIEKICCRNFIRYISPVLNGLNMQQEL